MLVQHLTIFLKTSKTNNRLMKNLYYLLIILILLIGNQSLFAGNVSLSDLKRVAINFFYEKNLISDQACMDSSNKLTLKLIYL